MFNPENDMRLKIALSQLQQNQGPVSSWAGGLNRVLQSLMAGYGIQQAEKKNELEADKRELAAVQLAKRLGLPSESVTSLSPEAQGSLMAQALKPTKWNKNLISATDAQGKPVLLQTSEAGELKAVEGYAPEKKITTIDLGGSKRITDEAALAQEMAKNQGFVDMPVTPDPNATLAYQGRIQSIDAANQRAAQSMAPASASRSLLPKRIPEQRR
jgi:hypothetical protein